jgi:hypothetical protein
VDTLRVLELIEPEAADRRLLALHGQVEQAGQEEEADAFRLAGDRRGDKGLAGALLFPQKVLTEAGDQLMLDGEDA